MHSDPFVCMLKHTGYSFYAPTHSIGYSCAFSDVPRLLEDYTSISVDASSTELPHHWLSTMSRVMNLLEDFVEHRDYYQDDLVDSCDWVRTYTGYTHHDGFCLVEDGADRDLDCTRFREYQKRLEVRTCISWLFVLM